MDVDAPTDPSAVRALASAVIAAAIHDATSPAAREDDRTDARLFLLADDDPRLERWCAALDLDPDALRSRLRRRIG